MPETAERLEQEEVKVLAYLHHSLPEQKDSFGAYIKQGRMGIMQRLLQAVIRENIIPGKLISWEGEEQETLNIRFHNGNSLRAMVKARHSLGRFDLAEEPVLLTERGETVLYHPVELLDLLKQEGLLAMAREEQVVRFRQEIENGTANFALSLAGAARRKQDMARVAQASGIGSSLAWAEQQAIKEESFSPLAFYEQCIVEGHPLHPGAKTKFGLETADVVRYSPEWGAAPRLALVAVSKEFCRVTSLTGQTVTDLLVREYPELWPHVQQYLAGKGLDAGGYQLIPVHPWQLNQTLPLLYADALHMQRIVPIEGYVIPAWALISFRSLAPLQRRGEQKHHIKTAINVQTTSAVRIVSPHSAENGPILSRVFSDIMEREHHFADAFVTLQERAGIYYNPADVTLAPDERWTLQANLAAILRENPEDHVREGEIPMPAAALMAVSPVSDIPIVAELIERLAVHRGIADRQEAAVQFIRCYAQTALPGFITFMVRYGVGLEGHMQNSVAVFRHGELVRMIVRDFGGVRIFPSRLERQGLSVNVYPGSSIVTEDVDSMRSILSYSVLQNHIAELITSIVRALGVTESLLWQPVIEVCRRVFAELKRDPQISEQAAADEEALFRPTIVLKTLATMRLQGDVTAYSFQKVPNPLYREKGEEIG